MEENLSMKKVCPGEERDESQEKVSVRAREEGKVKVKSN